MLYNTKGEVPDEEYVIPIGKAELKREGDHCSIITHGKMVLVAMQVADQLAKEGINIDVVDLRTIRPMDVEAITAVGAEDQPRRRARGRLGGVRRRRAGRGLHPARLLRRPRRTGRCACTRPTSRCPTRRTSRRPPSPTCRRRSPPCGKSCTSTDPPSHRQWQPKSSWRRSPPRWRRGAWSSGSRTRATRSRAVKRSPKSRPTRRSWSSSRAATACCASA